MFSSTFYQALSEAGKRMYMEKLYEYDFLPQGETYFVNNITGSATNDGLTWGTAFDEVSTAITAVIALQATQTSGDNIRNKIIIAGTSTAYAGLTELADYTDYIGTGTSPLGNGGGIPRIGSDTAAEDGFLHADGTNRGCNFYNLQFQCGTAKSCFSIGNLYRSEFHNVAFIVNGVAASATTGFTAAKLSGCVFDNIHIGTSSNVEPTIGFDVTGTHFHHCKITNSEISGLTAGFRVATGTTSGYGSILKNNFIGSHYGTCLICVDDNASTGQIMYCGNFLSGTATGTLYNNHAARWIGNYTQNGFSDVTNS